jgi:hypothetical protein
MSARLIYKRSRNAVGRVPQAPITIRRRKPSVFFSPTPSCKSDRLNSCRGVTVTAPLRVTCHLTTLLWRCAVTVTRHLLSREKFDNRHSTHGLD